MTSEEKRNAYNCDILYTTNNEVGFDYLRDNMVIKKEDLVQRDLNFAIVDEVDSALIDEARTPLIISGGARNTEKLYELADDFVKYLSEDDYLIDIKQKTIVLSESGIAKAESHFNIGPTSGDDSIHDNGHIGCLVDIIRALMEQFFDYIRKVLWQ